MTLLLTAAALVLLLLLAAWRIRSYSRRRDASDNLDTVIAWPPHVTRVLNHSERRAYDLLRQALPAQMILAQVPLQRFIKVPTRNSYAEWLRRVGHLHADFLVCDAHSQVIAAVELEFEDEEAGGRARRRRERMLRVLNAAQVPVHLWRAGALPTVAATREAIMPAPPLPERSALAELTDDVPVAADDPIDTIPSEPLREPPPSTWFDDFDTAPAPLGGAPVAPKSDPSRPASPR